MKITIVTTGGTIASVPMSSDTKTYTIALSGDALFKHFPDIDKFGCELTLDPLFCKGSSNLRDSDWLEIAREVLKVSASCDGVIVTHGTDTMAYTASALSYLLLGLDKPVIMTGSMMPPGSEGSDAQGNLYSSIEFMKQLISGGRRGVCICMAGKLYHAPRTVKTNSWRRDAFSSIDYTLLGVSDPEPKLTDAVPCFSDRSPFAGGQSLMTGGAPEFENDIMTLALFPGMDERQLERTVDMRPRAIIVEGFGTGGILYQLFPAIKRAVESGTHVIVRTQVLSGGTDLQMCDLGLKTAALGTISAGNMTREALICKLKLLLPLCDDRAELEERLLMNCCDDVVTEVSV